MTDNNKKNNKKVAVIAVVGVIVVFTIVLVIVAVYFHFRDKDNSNYSTYTPSKPINKGNQGDKGKATMNWTASGGWNGTFSVKVEGSDATYDVYDDTLNTLIINKLVSDGDTGISWGSTPPNVGDILKTSDGVSTSTKPLPSSFSTLVIKSVPNTSTQTNPDIIRYL